MDCAEKLSHLPLLTDLLENINSFTQNFFAFLFFFFFLSYEVKYFSEE